MEGQSRESMVENIEFSGLTFKDTNTTDWYAYGWNWGDAGDGLGFYPKEAEGSTQPSYCEQTERIEFQYGNITLKNTKKYYDIKIPYHKYRYVRNRSISCQPEHGDRRTV